MSGPTPGRWTICHDGNGRIDIKTAFDLVCMDVASEEDARLIAAAPDLLRELIEAEWTVDDVDDANSRAFCPCCGLGKKDGHAPACSLHAAIAKATGSAS